MAVDRMRQVNELLRFELASEFSGVLDLPTGVVVSITKVIVSPDLHHANIFVSILPDNEAGSTLKLLRKQLSRVIDQAKPRIKLRHLPHFQVRIDETERKAQHIERLLDSLK